MMREEIVSFGESLLSRMTPEEEKEFDAKVALRNQAKAENRYCELCYTTLNDPLPLLFCKPLKQMQRVCARCQDWYKESLSGE